MNEQRNTRIIDIKKHTGSAQCSLYDVTVYDNIKVYPYKGRLYSKMKFEEVEALLAQGKFKPNTLSERLFDKILGEYKNEEDIHKVETKN